MSYYRLPSITESFPEFFGSPLSIPTLTSSPSPSHEPFHVMTSFNVQVEYWSNQSLTEMVSSRTQIVPEEMMTNGITSINASLDAWNKYLVGGRSLVALYHCQEFGIQMSDSLVTWPTEKPRQIELMWEFASRLSSAEENLTSLVRRLSHCVTLLPRNITSTTTEYDVRQWRRPSYPHFVHQLHNMGGEMRLLIARMRQFCELAGYAQPSNTVKK